MSAGQEIILAILREHGPMTVTELEAVVPRTRNLTCCVSMMCKHDMIEVVGMRGRAFVYGVRE